MSHDVGSLIRAIRDERNRRRANVVAKLFHPDAPPAERYTWDNMGGGPYAGYDALAGITAVDVIGLMHDLGYHATRPGGEAKALTEVEAELKRLVSSEAFLVTPPHLQMLVATAHRILVSLRDTGDLRKANTHEGKKRG